MKYIDINGKLIRKDPKYYLEDVLEIPEYDGSYEKLEDFLDNISTETEIHMINTGCIPGPLLELFKSKSMQNNNLIVEIDD